MSDLLGVVVDGDMLKTFCNMFELVIALDVFTMFAYLISHAKGAFKD